MHTDDWTPQLYKLPHRQRDDYFLYGKWLFAPSGKLRMNLSAAKSRSQFDRYFWKYLFNMDHFRSDLRKGDLQAFNVNYMPDARKLITLVLSRLYTNTVYGVRELRDYGPFDDFVFRDLDSLRWWFGSINNPFGVRRAYFPREGDYPEYRDRTSTVYKANVSTSMQMHTHHEIKAGFEYAYHAFDNFTYWISSVTTNPITDEWQYNPVEYSMFVQDNIDYKGLYAKVGCRYDYFSSDIEGVNPKSIISPRVGFSFLVTEKFLFRANVGRYAQPPLYDYMYSYYQYLPYPSYIQWVLRDVPIGNPELGPEQTISYEIGLQGDVRENMSITVNAFYKDISDLVGTRLIVYEALKYTQYFNVEYANVRGTEAIAEFANSFFTGKVSYTLSWARGSSSHALEFHNIYWRDTTYVPPSEDYYLDFDQRHRIFVQGAMRLPLQARLYVFGYLGHGFPYTPPGPEGKITERNVLRLSFRRQIDCIISKPIHVGNFICTINLEVINLLDARYQVRWYSPYLDAIMPWECDAISIRQPYYHPAADFNHDGLITPYEEFQAQKALEEATNEFAWAECYTSPRRARVGINVSF
jgi:outer membrane receptor protein involved in Fe transport